jgi:hypothetical protein
MEKKYFIVLIVICSFYSTNAQVKVRGHQIFGLDFYQWFRNPYCSDCKNTNESSSGSVFSSPLGVRVIVGENNFSIGAEAAVNIGLFNLDLNGYKGLGAMSFPLLLKANFNGLSGLSKNKLIGFSIGGGIQYSKTELFGLSKKYQELDRSFFPTYVGEIGIGGGVSGSSVVWNTRVGIGKNHAFVFNTGLVFYINYFKQKTKQSQPQLKS